jgi:hypothetical protein
MSHFGRSHVTIALTSILFKHIEVNPIDVNRK